MDGVSKFGIYFLRVYIYIYYVLQRVDIFQVLAISFQGCKWLSW